jgi:hypothetical protein
VPIDWNRALERADELKAEGYSDSQVSAVLDQEARAADEAAQRYGHANARGARTTLQGQRSALNAEAAPPGQEPAGDPIEGMIESARRSGAPRGSENYINAGLESLFESARAGDPRVVSDGTVDRETAERWHRDGVERQVANRERSGFTPHN